MCALTIHYVSDYFAIINMFFITLLYSTLCSDCASAKTYNSVSFAIFDLDNVFWFELKTLHLFLERSHICSFSENRISALQTWATRHACSHLMWPTESLSKSSLLAYIIHVNSEYPMRSFEFEYVSNEMLLHFKCVSCAHCSQRNYLHVNNSTSSPQFLGFQAFWLQTTSFH